MAVYMLQQCMNVSFGGGQTGTLLGVPALTFGGCEGGVLAGVPSGGGNGGRDSCKGDGCGGGGGGGRDEGILSPVAQRLQFREWNDEHRPAAAPVSEAPGPAGSALPQPPPRPVHSRGGRACQTLIPKCQDAITHTKRGCKWMQMHVDDMAGNICQALHGGGGGSGDLAPATSTVSPGAPAPFNSVSGLVSKVWYRIPFDHSELSISKLLRT